ncbi:MAG TPA: GWxTD domain-containing protein, partial [Thermoanaerobaculia bacterium]
MIRSAATILACILIVATVAVAAGTLPELFQKGKEEFKHKDYKRSLATFEELDRMSLQPQFAADRQKLAPAIAFYRGANLAALGRKAEAVEQFESYIGAMPNAALDEKLYPKEVIAAFNQARQNARESAGDIAEVYARFHPAPGATPAADEHWTLTPVRYLMTGEEKTRWAELQTNEDRAAFVTEFWAKRDPSAGTPENEFRSEFERRVLFCDAAFAAAEQRGSETDTAVVFTFFGAPSYVRAT